MIKKILLDTNLLIGALDGEINNKQHQEAFNLIKEYTEDSNIRLAITPLIRYEVLRGMSPDRASALNKILNQFEEIDVSSAIALRAAELFAISKIPDKSAVKLDKRAFDLFHCVCAELNGLEINSQDGDIKKIKELINQNPRT